MWPTYPIAIPAPIHSILCMKRAKSFIAGCGLGCQEEDQTQFIIIIITDVSNALFKSNICGSRWCSMRLKYTHVEHGLDLAWSEPIPFCPALQDAHESSVLPVVIWFNLVEEAARGLSIHAWFHKRSCFCGLRSGAP